MQFNRVPKRDSIGTRKISVKEWSVGSPMSFTHIIVSETYSLRYSISVMLTTVFSVKMTLLH